MNINKFLVHLPIVGFLYLIYIGVKYGNVTLENISFYESMLIVFNQIFSPIVLLKLIHLCN